VRRRKTGGKAGSLEMRSCLRGCNVWGCKRTSTSTKVNATAERRSATWSSPHRGRGDANQKNWCDANHKLSHNASLVVRRPHRTGLRRSSSSLHAIASCAFAYAVSLS
jgi:hypothetical protein